MKNFSLLAIATAAILSSVAAHADEADGSQNVIRVMSTRSAAEVRAEAVNPVHVSNGGTGFIGVLNSGVSADAVKAQAIQSARTGQTSRGEM